jgi:DNA polymerase-1
LDILHRYLIKKKWEGSVCPSVSKLELDDFKLVYPIIADEKIPSARRSLEKMLIEVAEYGNERGQVLVNLFSQGKLQEVNDLLRASFKGTPNFNVGSPKQIINLLYTVMQLPIRLVNKLTDSNRAKGEKQGSPRSDEDAMKMAVQMQDVAAGSEEATVLTSLIALKSINTARGLYYDGYPKFVHWKTNRIHPELKQSGTNTRRHSSKSPNIQQLDSSYGGIRSVILPHKPSAVIASLDLAAQEVRLAAHYSRDKNLLSCYVGEKHELRDVHSIVAARIAGCSYDQFVARRKGSDAKVAAKADKIRSIAKTVVFASFYGAAAPKIAETLGISTDEAQTYLDALDSEFSGLTAWKTRTESKVASQGFVTIHGGTVRHLRQAINSEDTYEKSKALRQASNSRIQGAGANQLKRIMSDIWDSRLIEDFDYRWMFPVHDETVHSIGRQDAVQVLGILHKIMTRDFLDGVPSGSSIGIGKNFGELTEIGEVFDEQLVRDALEKI